MTLHKTLIGDGFNQCKSDECLYTLHRKGAVVFMLVYVDDIIIASSHPWLTEAVERMLAKHYEIKLLGELKWYLGLHVEQTAEHIKIHQHSYIQQVLTRFKMEDCNTEKTPLATGVQLSKSDAPQTEEEKGEMLSYPYRSLVGSLMYLMLCTRPDIAYALGVLARFGANHGMAHWKAGKRVLNS